MPNPADTSPPASTSDLSALRMGFLMFPDFEELVLATVQIRF